jgi:hypothetical protein
MRSALCLSEAEIAEIREAWLAGDSIATICDDFRHGTQQIRTLAIEQGWPDRDRLRDALPPGHASTWGAICGHVSGAGADFSHLMGLLWGVNTRHRKPNRAAC